MGSLVSRVQGFCGRMMITKTSIAILGLDGGGKTTILYRLKLNETIKVIPTIGFHVETLNIIDGTLLLAWDVSFGAKGKPLLKHYLINCKGFVFVVDSTETERFQEAKEFLLMLLHDTGIEDIPFIVLANKQDLNKACHPLEVARHLDLESNSSRKWAVFGFCGLTGEGIKEALETLCTMIKEDTSQ